MICANTLDNGQPCGDEGHVCDVCFRTAMAEHAYLRHVPRVINDAQAQEEFEQEIRDAGRGHLLLDREIDQHDLEASAADDARTEIWS
jgi:hypothetical protein